MGSTLGVEPLPPTGWKARTSGRWISRLFQDPAFVAQVAARWDQLKPSFEAVADSVPATGAGLAAARSNDALRWGDTALASDTPQFLSDWLHQRIDWMDAQFHPPPG
jgi:hypothetical protein